MTLNDAFPNGVFGDGIFNILSTLYTMPWNDRKLSHGEIDTDYFGIFGDRTVSPLVKKFTVNCVLSQENIERLAHVIYNRFYKQWDMLYKTMYLEYNPISNYDMTETEQTNGTRHDTTKRETTANNSSDSNTNTNTFGFNSAESVPSDNTILNSNVVTNGTEADIAEGNTNTDRTLKRTGNIGVTTSQQMIESERNIWIWDYFKTIYKNVNEILTIPYYEYNY